MFDFGMLGGIMSGLGSLAGGIGGLFKGGGNNDWNSQQMQMQMQLAREQLAFQREAATSGIRWKVHDAKEAGLHPLYALGGQTFNPNPISISGVGDNSGGGPDIGGSIAQMGQGIGRAVAATQTPAEQRDQHVKDMLIAKQVEKLDSEIMLNKANAERALRTAPGTGPGLPTIANTVHGPVEMKPPEVLIPNPENPGTTAGPSSPGNTQYSVDRTGAVVTMPSKDLNIDEASSPGWLSWMIRNRVWPAFSSERAAAAAPPLSQLPNGAYRWRFTPFGWEPVYHSEKYKSEFNPRHYNRHQRSDSY